MVVYTRVPFVQTTLSVGVVLKLNGVGFRAFSARGWLVCQTGYSHYTGVRVPVTGQVRPGKSGVAVVGPGLQRRVTRLRQPDPYKARGIYSVGLPPVTKPGKRR